jgi:AraC-like DNA-binding protein
MSPMNLLSAKKIRCAKKLLKPSIQINEVCYLSGFDDSYFIRLFKKHEGITKTIPVIVHELVYSMYFTGSKLCSSSGVNTIFNLRVFSECFQ